MNRLLLYHRSSLTPGNHIQILKQHIHVLKYKTNETLKTIRSANHNKHFFAFIWLLIAQTHARMRCTTTQERGTIQRTKSTRITREKSGRRVLKADLVESGYSSNSSTSSSMSMSSEGSSEERL